MHLLADPAAEPPISAASRHDQPPQVDFLGLRFSTCREPKWSSCIIEGARRALSLRGDAERLPCRYASMRRPDRLLPIYRGAWLSLCDSHIVRLLARLERDFLPLVTGSDLVAALLATLNGQNPHICQTHSCRRAGAQHGNGAARLPIHNLNFEILPAPAGLAAKRRAAACRGPRLHGAAMGYCAVLRRLPGAGTDRAASRRARLQIRHRALRRRPIDFLTGARRAPRGCSGSVSNGPIVWRRNRSRLWRRYLVAIAENLSHLHGNPLGRRPLMTPAGSLLFRSLR